MSILDSLLNEELILDVPFEIEEVESAVRHLKRRKSAGPDGLVAEHLQGGGRMLVKWLTRLLNAVVELEVIPDSLKSGLVIPIYKGSGKDPLCLDSYRGITITSVISKVLESLLLRRMESTFDDAGILT